MKLPRAQVLIWALLGALMIYAPQTGAQTAPQTGAQTALQTDTTTNIPQVDASGAMLPRPAGTTAMTAVTAGQQQVGQQQAGQPPEPQTDVAGQTSALDYGAWDLMAAKVEGAILDARASDAALEQLRRQLVDWRAALLGAQNANSARIATLRSQIAALGPATEGGAPEAEDLAKRRSALTEQLVRLQAPGITAEEAYSRADGLIGEIDRTVRERQADQLLTIWPAPINPANWPEAVIGLTDTGVRLWDEVVENWGDDTRRADFLTNLPLIVIVLAMGMGLTIYARAWVQNLAMRLRERGGAGAQRIVALLASLGEMVFPIIGLALAVVALDLSGMAGELGRRILDAFVSIAFPLIAAAWMAGRIFPRGTLPGPLNLGTEGRAEARVLTVLMGLLLGVERLRFAAMNAQDYSEGTTSVTTFPGLVISGLLLVRMGQLLSRHLNSLQIRDSAAGGDTQNFGRSVLGLVARGAILIGLFGPVLAGIGYVAGASALIYPAILSLGLIAVLLILQHLTGDIYTMATRTHGEATDALIPVLANFALAVGSVPIFALVWGARTADLTEMWTRFREGFQLGTTRISPTDFLFFAVVFAIGYGLTRLFQGALKSTILPRTGLDQGAQNAAISGVGYVGIITAALIAINTAGIDLSGLAIVAGALSVGIGFGLQNIVSNFVSGIILLIERPVSEGDWIEVGTTSGIVKAISVRSTRIQTFDKSDVIVPNTDLVAGRVTNWTHFNLSGRITVQVAARHGSDSRRIEQILREVAEAQPQVLMQPPPVVALVGFGLETQNFEIRAILRDVNFQVQVRSEINHQIAARFAAEGVVFSIAHGDAAAKMADAAAPNTPGPIAAKSASKSGPKSGPKPSPMLGKTPKAAS